MPVSAVEVLMDLLEDQENAVRSIAVHLSVGQDISALQLEEMLQLKKKFEETCECLEAMIQRWSIPDSFAQAG